MCRVFGSWFLFSTDLSFVILQIVEIDGKKVDENADEKEWLAKQDLSKLNAETLTPLTEEVC